MRFHVEREVKFGAFLAWGKIYFAIKVLFDNEFAYDKSTADIVNVFEKHLVITLAFRVTKQLEQTLLRFLGYAVSRVADGNAQLAGARQELYCYGHLSAHISMLNSVWNYV